MDEQAFRFDITPAEASHLEVLQHTFDPDTLSKDHDKRYEVQKQGVRAPSKPCSAKSLF